MEKQKDVNITNANNEKGNISKILTHYEGN